MVGIPGSGKSTYLRLNEKYFNPSHVIVSRDAIRFSMLKDGDDYFSKETAVFNKFVKLISQGLVMYDEVYADATHLNKISRTKLLNALRPYLRDVELYAIVIKVPLDQAVIQNGQRSGRARVPDSALVNMHKNFTIPTLEEGFKEIWLYTSPGYQKGFKLEKIR